LSFVYYKICCWGIWLFPFCGSHASFIISLAEIQFHRKGKKKKGNHQYEWKKPQKSFRCALFNTSTIYVVKSAARKS
jgi:hypothetical protein